MDISVGARTCGVLLWATLVLATRSPAFAAPALTPEQVKDIKQNFAFCVSKLKGPYVENTCVCPNGSKRPIRSAGGSLGTACEKPIFCAAYRAAWAEALTKHRLYLGNIFSRDVYEWSSYSDHNDVVRGYLLEKYFTESNPQHKLAQLRSFRGLASSEEVAPAATKFYELYLAAPEFDAKADFLLAYELQRRFLLRADVGQIEKLRSAATRIESMDSRFKLLKDSIHIQVSAGLIAPLSDYRDKLPQGKERTELQAVIDQIRKFTTVDESALEPTFHSLQDEALGRKLAGGLPAADADPVSAISSLAQLMVEARQVVGAKRVAPADARRLVDANVIAASALQNRTNKLLETRAGLSEKQHQQLLVSLANATYGVGLLNDRERDEASNLKQAGQLPEWAKANAIEPFAEVWAPWTTVLPQVATIGDDILRSSPVPLYTRALARLDDGR